jgi:hypothetical protein
MVINNKIDKIVNLNKENNQILQNEIVLGQNDLFIPDFDEMKNFLIFQPHNNVKKVLKKNKKRHATQRKTLN